MSSYNFHDWKNAPKDMGIDLMIVGSDQIWNKRINNPLDYMPAHFPKGLPSMTYAASMGMPEIPVELVEDFKKWIPQFKALSVREPDLQAELAKLGIIAKHVADPVVLFGAENWRKVIGNVNTEKGRCFVYPFWRDQLRLKNDITNWTTANVDIFPCRHFASIPSLRQPMRLLKNIPYWIRLLQGSRVRLRLMAGPLEYLRSLARSEFVVTNSFHGFILGVILGKNVRYVVPEINNIKLRDMLGRIKGYVDQFIDGPLLQPSWSEAFLSIKRGDKIKVDFAGLEAFREESLDWLKNAIISINDI